MKKRLLALILIFTIGSTLFALDLVVRKTDGTSVRIPISDIVSMTYEDGIAVGEKSASAKTYSVGDPGPAGGFILYDKGVFSDGWRYIEMAPASAEGKDKPWYVASNDIFNLGTKEELGSSISNTKAIVEKYRSNGMMGTPDKWAASYCDNLTYGGYDDWAMPCREELALMYTDFHRNGKGGFANYYYWASSEYDGYNVWYLNFETGTQYVIARDYEINVRPVRYF